MINVKGYRLLVKADDIERMSKGGIVIVHENEQREKSNMQFGKVIQVGHTCWKGEAFDSHNVGGYKNKYIPWCNVGDKVMFSKHSGRFVYDPEDNEEYLIMNDTDILAVVGE